MAGECRGLTDLYDGPCQPVGGAMRGLVPEGGSGHPRQGDDQLEQSRVPRTGASAPFAAGTSSPLLHVRPANCPSVQLDSNRLSQLTSQAIRSVGARTVAGAPTRARSSRRLLTPHPHIAFGPGDGLRPATGARRALPPRIAPAPVPRVVGLGGDAIRSRRDAAMAVAAVTSSAMRRRLGSRARLTAGI